MSNPFSRPASRRLLIVACLVFALAAIDAQRAPQRQCGTRLALAAINAWQRLSPVLVASGGCLYTPSCSVYGELAVRRYGGYRGSYLALRRIMRCSRWATTTGEDWP